MIRKIIHIDEEKCIGCELCAQACHEGAIGMVNGKAKLLRDDYCDGLGDCLPVCPAQAITFVEREATPYDKAAVVKNQKAKKKFTCASQNELPCGSQLSQWPVQIQLAPLKAPYFDKASLLIAADCTAYAYGNFHQDFIKGKITLIGCPKLDCMDYSEKLTGIIKENDIKEIFVVRMEVPCCSGIEHAVKSALLKSGKTIALQVATISTDGKILEG